MDISCHTSPDVAQVVLRVGGREQRRRKQWTDLLPQEPSALLTSAPHSSVIDEKPDIITANPQGLRITLHLERTFWKCSTHTHTPPQSDVPAKWALGALLGAVWKEQVWRGGGQRQVRRKPGAPRPAAGLGSVVQLGLCPPPCLATLCPPGLQPQPGPHGPQSGWQGLSQPYLPLILWLIHIHFLKSCCRKKDS